MSDHITDPHASGLDHGLTSALHSPFEAENNAREKQKWDEFKASIPTDEASIRAAFSKAVVDGDPFMSIPAHPTDADLVLKKAIDELIASRATIATLTARAEAAERERDHGHATLRFDFEQATKDLHASRLAHRATIRATETEIAGLRAKLERVTRERDDSRAYALNREEALDESQRRRDLAGAEIDRLRAAVEEAVRRLGATCRVPCTDSRCSLARRLTAALSPAPGEEEACTWTEDGGGEWRTTCGESWVTLDGEPPDEHHVRFCHGCGRRAALAPFSPEDGAAPASEPEEDEGQKHSIDECPACGGWMPQFSEKVHDGMAYECKSCGAEVIGYVLDGRVWTEAAPYETPPEEARGEAGRCRACAHPPHTGMCTRRNGRTAYPCPCIQSSCPTPIPEKASEA